MMRIVVLGLSAFLLLAGLALLALGPLFFRMRLVDLPTAMDGMQQLAMWSLVGAVGMGLVGLVLAFVGAKHRAGIVGVLLVAASGMAAGAVYGRNASRGDLPPIHDAQTDWTSPVAFTEATLKARADAGAVRVRDDALVPEGNGRWTGLPFSQAQAVVYGDIEPLVLNATPQMVAEAAVRAAERRGWRVTTRDIDGGVIEAVYRSPWYELEHDVAVRVVAEGSGSRVDVRATSRLPGHDMGANASLVKQMVDEIVMAL
jgi:hypothetical protein